MLYKSSLFATIFKCIVLNVCMVFCLLANAETPYTCPSINSVHHLNQIWPNGPWLPLYVDNDELASMDDIENFSKVTTHFVRAEWSGNFLELAHCYYEGNEKIHIARDMLKPDMTLFPHWESVSTEKLVCTSLNEDDCPYSGIG